MVQTARRPVQLPWEPRERVELIDGPTAPPAAEPIIADLRMLPYEQRAAVILALCGTTAVQIAKVLERPVGHVSLSIRQGANALAAGHPERATDEALTRELNDDPVRERHDSAEDMAHGRWLSRAAGSSEARWLSSRWLC